MAKNVTEERCGTGPVLTGMKCCQVDGLVTVDGRGQIVLPKDVREKARVKTGDKLVIISHESGGRVCCFTLLKAEEFAGSVKDVLGPVMKEILQ